MTTVTATQEPSAEQVSATMRGRPYVVLLAVFGLGRGPVGWSNHGRFRPRGRRARSGRVPSMNLSERSIVIRDADSEGEQR
jgi:hypothetical protein